jgi:hypothetical protein
MQILKDLKMKENKRLEQLFAVLIFDTDTAAAYGSSYLSVQHRICINQERANLMRDFPNPKFEQYASVNEKVDFVLGQIRNNKLSHAYLAQVQTLINN